MKNDFVMPILVLTLICLIFTGALAYTNSITAPIIAQAASDRADAARYEIIPEAEGFVVVETEGLPDSIREVYRTSNDVGFIFMVTVSGYGGDIQIVCGVAPDGKIIRSNVLSQNETKGLGSRIADASFADQFIGIAYGFDGVVAISGATKSTNAYLKAINDVFEAFEIVKGVS